AMFGFRRSKPKAAAEQSVLPTPPDPSLDAPQRRWTEPSMRYSMDFERPRTLDPRADEPVISLPIVDTTPLSEIEPSNKSLLDDVLKSFDEKMAQPTPVRVEVPSVSGVYFWMTSMSILEPILGLTSPFTLQSLNY